MLVPSEGLPKSDLPRNRSKFEPETAHLRMSVGLRRANVKGRASNSGQFAEIAAPVTVPRPRRDECRFRDPIDEQVAK